MNPNTDPNASALFTNFTTDTFIGYWNGKGRVFEPGQSAYLPYSLAAHYAKHLVNRELLRTKEDGSAVYPNGEKMTSPKRPDDVPLFMELFNKAVQVTDTPSEQKKDNTDALIDEMNRNRGVEPPKVFEAAKPAYISADAPEGAVAPKTQDPNEPQIVLSPDFDGGDEDAQSPSSN